MKTNLSRLLATLTITACGTAAPSFPETLPPVVPGANEAAVILADPGGPDRESEVGSFWIQRGSLRIQLGTVSCKPGGAGPCRTVDACAPSVTVEVCAFASPTSPPAGCGPVTLTTGALTVITRGAYTGVRMTKDLCIAGRRRATPIAPSTWYWRFTPPHSRAGQAPDLTDGGGTPMGGSTWYVEPIQ